MTPIDLVIKQYLRAFLTAKMSVSKAESQAFGRLAAIIVREPDLEKFLDEMWMSINQQRLTEQRHEEGT